MESPRPNAITSKKGAYDLTYFTHEVEGQTQGGWFRVVGDSIEVLAKGMTRLQPLYGSAPEIEARSILQEIVKSHAALGSGRNQT